MGRVTSLYSDGALVGAKREGQLLGMMLGKLVRLARGRRKG